MHPLLEPIRRLTPGHLLLVGLTLFVLGVMLGLVSGSAAAACFGGAIAVWLAAAALWAFERMQGAPELQRRVAAGVPAGLALVVALVAVASAAQTVGIGAPSTARSGSPTAEHVAGATATGATATAATATATPSDSAAGSTSDTPSTSPTDSPGPTDSPTPAETAEPTPTPQPTSAQLSGPITIASVSATSPVARGESATVTAQVTPGATCSIRVTNASRSSASGLGAQVVPDSGSVSWTWTVSTRARRGVAAATVTCADTDSTAWDTTTFVVQ